MRLAPTREPRQGVVLLAVLIVVALLTLAAYQYFDLMQAEAKAADSYARSTQARAMAESGINYTAMILSNKNAYNTVLAGNPYNNPQVFQNQLVQDGDAPRFRGRFTVISPLGPDDAPQGAYPYNFGVIDEAGKLNLNGLLKIDSSGETAKMMLMKLPNMTQDIANAILDWIDTDETVRDGGAENEYYTGLGYSCKNGPLETLEELLYVKGVTPQLLFGNDFNRNGILDPEESGERDLGWAAYLTVYGREQNVDGLGKPRIYINDTNTIRLYDSMTQMLGMTPELANYIILYRQYGPAKLEGIPAISGLGNIPNLTSGLQVDILNPGDLQRQQLNLSERSRGKRRIASMFELVGSFVAVGNTNDPRNPPKYYGSPLNSSDGLNQLLPILLEKLTTSKDTDLPARVNILTAPRQVLLALPGITEKDVDSIMEARPAVLAEGATSDAIFSAATAIFVNANLSPDTLRAIERYITVRTQMYRMQVIGHFDSGGPFFRAEAIIDTNNGRPRIVYWRDLTELGRGFELPRP